ncbi:DnaJ domain-containing protein [Desulfobacterales bacterium HSG16]|nr:DnaJ domain-containing protein [Desulfobacterales bacterium HSG16]
MVKHIEKTGVFEALISRVDTENIREHLGFIKTPCYESVLFKIAFPDADIAKEPPLGLYQKHFVLFHILYLLQKEYEAQSKYLHIHFMRIFLADLPESGHCRFYEELTGSFCNSHLDNDSINFCTFHMEKHGGNEIDRISDRYYYLDCENFYRLDEKTATAFLNGTWELLANYNQFEKSFSVLGIDKTFDIKLIKTKFRYLAKKYHPDKGEKSHIRFNEINRAYRVLLKIIPFVSTS